MAVCSATADGVPISARKRFFKHRLAVGYIMFQGACIASSFLMAAMMNRVLKLSIVSFMKPNRSVIGPLLVTRNIFGDTYLNIDQYVQLREKTALQFHGMKDKFTTRMNNYLKSSTHGMIFTDDLKHMVHLAENNPDDLTLVIAMMKKFNQQNEQLRFDSYIFGPVIMRMLHYLDVPDVAYQVIKDPDLVDFFDQTTSYNIAMNLLYNHGQYSRVLDLFDTLIARQFNASKFPRDAVVLMSAACYKLNTDASLKHAIKILQNCKETGAMILRRAVTFVTGLALKQNQPVQALDILNLTTQINYFTVKNLKVIALVQVNRIDDALIILRNAIERDAPDTSRKVPNFSEETIAIVKDAIEQSKDKELILQFERMEQALKEHNCLTKNTIDESLCTPILRRPAPRTDSRIVGFESRFFLPSSSRTGRQQRQNLPQRQRLGLLDDEE